MNDQPRSPVDGPVRRAEIFAALGDPTRLAIAERLAGHDATPSELAQRLGIGSNLLAHHLHQLEVVGLVRRARSEGDRRRSYLSLDRSALARLELAAAQPGRRPSRVLFVCTGNSARSQLAAALWRRASRTPVACAGTHPGARINPGAIAAAARHGLPLRRRKPVHLDQVAEPGDLVVTVCDLAREELGARGDLHWSVPDPVRRGSDAAFDAALADLAGRVADLAPRVDGLLLSQSPAGQR